MILPLHLMSPKRLNNARFSLAAPYVFTVFLCYAAYLFVEFQYPQRRTICTSCPSGADRILESSLSSSNEFPKKIWQTTKTPAMVLDRGDSFIAQTWLQHNPTFRYESLTSYGSESYVNEHFSDKPDIRETFQSISDPIFRADLVRYLVLLAEGGVYSDLDTKCLQPISNWIPAWYAERANIVVGIEYDQLDDAILPGFSSGIQFSTWTIMAKPGHPVMESTVARVLKQLKRLAYAQNTTVSGIRASYQDVMSTTGPAAFTAGVFQYLRDATGKTFTDHNLTRLSTPELIGDVLILPVTSFGAGQHHSQAGSVNEVSALVEHLFHGSWKADHLYTGSSLPEGEEKVEGNAAKVDAEQEEEKADMKAAEEAQLKENEESLLNLAKLQELAQQSTPPLAEVTQEAVDVTGIVAEATPLAAEAVPVVAQITSDI